MIDGWHEALAYLVIWGGLGAALALAKAKGKRRRGDPFPFVAGAQGVRE